MEFAIEKNSVLAITSVVFYIILLVFVIASWVVFFGLMKYGKNKFLVDVVMLLYAGASLLAALYGILQLNKLG